MAPRKPVGTARIKPTVEVPSRPPKTNDPASSPRPKRSRNMPTRHTEEIDQDNGDSAQFPIVQSIESDSEYDGDDSKSRKKPKLSAAQKRKHELREIARRGPPKEAQRKRVELYTDQLYDIIDELDFELAKNKHELAKVFVDLEREKAKYAELKNVDLANSRTRVQKKDIKLGELRDKTSDQSKQLKAAKDEVKSLQETLRNQEATFLHFQTKNLEKVDASEIKIDFDLDVGGSFSKVFRTMKAIIRRYAISSWDHLDRDASKAVLEFVLDTNQPAIVSEHYGRSAILNELIAPNIVANALLNRYLVQLLLAHPFAIATGVETGCVNHDAAAALQRIWTEIREPPAAAKFRSTVALSLLERNDTSYDDDEFDLLVSKTERFAKHVVKSALQMLDFLLNISDSSRLKAENEMLRCVQECIVISVRIHAQPLFTRPAWGDELDHERYNGFNERLEVHAAMKIKDDNDPDSPGQTAQMAGILGRSADLIVEPLVLRSGDEMGKVWQDERLVNRALVWICNPNDVNKASTAAAEKPPASSVAPFNKKPQPAKPANAPSTLSHWIDTIAATITTKTKQATGLSTGSTLEGSHGSHAGTSPRDASGISSERRKLPTIKQESDDEVQGIKRKHIEHDIPRSPNKSASNKRPRQQNIDEGKATKLHPPPRSDGQPTSATRHSGSEQARRGGGMGSGYGSSTVRKSQATQYNDPAKPQTSQNR